MMGARWYRVLFGGRVRLLGMACLIGLFGTVTGQVGDLVAQEADRFEDDPKVPYLNGHVFSVTDLVPDPFIGSFLRSTLGMSRTAGPEVPLAVIDGDTIPGPRGQVLFAQLGFEFQQAIREWVAVRARATVVGRLGDDVGSLLATGVSANVGFELGWLFKLLRTERVMLSGSVDVSNNSFTTISLVDFIEDIVNDRDAQLVRKTPSLRTGGGLRFAWGVSELFGVIAFGETGYGESVVRDSSDEWYSVFGATADFDLAAKTAVPLGIAIGYQQDSFPEGGADITEVVRSGVLRFGYTGRSDFTVGLSLSAKVLPVRGLDDKVRAFSGTFEMRYFF